MKIIYIIVANNAKFEKNIYVEQINQKMVVAASTKEVAKKIIKELEQENEIKKTEHFRNKRYGIFPSEYIIKELELY